MNLCTGLISEIMVEVRHDFSSTARIHRKSVLFCVSPCMLFAARCCSPHQLMRSTAEPRSTSLCPRSTNIRPAVSFSCRGLEARLSLLQRVRYLYDRCLYGLSGCVEQRHKHAVFRTVCCSYRTVPCSAHGCLTINISTNG